MPFLLINRIITGNNETWKACKIVSCGGKCQAPSQRTASASGMSYLLLHVLLMVCLSLSICLFSLALADLICVTIFKYFIFLSVFFLFSNASPSDLNMLFSCEEKFDFVGHVVPCGVFTLFIE